MLLLRTVSSATPVFLLRITEEDRLRFMASSNILAVDVSRMLLLDNYFRYWSELKVKWSCTYVIELSTGCVILELLDQFLELVSREVIDVGLGVYIKKG